MSLWRSVTLTASPTKPNSRAFGPRQRRIFETMASSNWIAFPLRFGTPFRKLKSATLMPLSMYYKTPSYEWRVKEKMMTGMAFENDDTSRGTRILRPGMVLLKNFISLDDQVKMVGVCRCLGLGEGGFYQPRFKSGRKLHLQMMCLGLDWDPQTKKYGETRQLDGARPPPIPDSFISVCASAIAAANNLICENADHSDGSAVDILPLMHPNICIVNRYKTSGRLGLHQDKDESRESLEKGLPVVSISLGDSAMFLYGEDRNIKKADEVLLESGDVLIFGGCSRLIYHAVNSIIPRSAPAAFQLATNLPGRLNLTFREF